MTLREIAETIIKEDMGTRKATAYKAECYKLMKNQFASVEDYLEALAEIEIEIF